MANLLDNIEQRESGGDPFAQNPRSSAFGNMQFIDSTWLDVIKKHRPDLANRPDAEILALRGDPVLGRAMAGHYADDNRSYLQSQGLSGDDGQVSLAHLLGPGAAEKVLKAPKGTPVSAVLDPNAIASNPAWQGLTTDQLIEDSTGGILHQAFPEGSFTPITTPTPFQIGDILPAGSFLPEGAESAPLPALNLSPTKMLRDPPDPNAGMLSRAWDRGMISLAEGHFGLEAGFEDLIGDPSPETIEKIRNAQAEMKLYPREVQDLLKPGSKGNFALGLVERGIENIPVLLDMIAEAYAGAKLGAWGAGAGAARVVAATSIGKQLAKAAVTKVGEKNAAWYLASRGLAPEAGVAIAETAGKRYAVEAAVKAGATSGALAPMAGTEYGQMIGEQIEGGVPVNGWVPVPFALGAGMLEAVVPAALIGIGGYGPLKLAMGKFMDMAGKTRAGRAAAGGGGAMLGAGLTESAQEILAISARSAVDEAYSNVPMSDKARRVLEAGLVGSFIGLHTGAVVGALSKGKSEEELIEDKQDGNVIDLVQPTVETPKVGEEIPAVKQGYSVGVDADNKIVSLQRIGSPTKIGIKTEGSVTYQGISGVTIPSTRFQSFIGQDLSVFTTAVLPKADPAGTSATPAVEAGVEATAKVQTPAIPESEGTVVPEPTASPNASPATEIPVGPEPSIPSPTKITGFTTAKGSTYTVHEDGTTTRNKAARADVGHEGDSGAKERSARTIYILKNEAAQLSAAGLSNIGEKGARVVLKDGKAWLLSWNKQANKWGTTASGKQGFLYMDTPKVGFAPLELWNLADDVPDAYTGYKGMHAGNEIVSMTEAEESVPTATEVQSDSTLTESSDSKYKVITNSTKGANNFTRLYQVWKEHLAAKGTPGEVVNDFTAESYSGKIPHERILQLVHKFLAGFETKPTIILLPKGIAPPELENALGFVYTDKPNEIHLQPHLAKNESQFVRALFHETLVHFGFRALPNQKAVETWLAAVWVGREKRITQIATEEGWDVNDPTQRLWSIEEWVARQVRIGKQDQLIQRLIAFTRRRLRIVLPELKISAAEIRVMLGAAHRNLRKKNGKATASAGPPRAMFVGRKGISRDPDASLRLLDADKMLAKTSDFNKILNSTGIWFGNIDKQARLEISDLEAKFKQVFADIPESKLFDKATIRLGDIFEHPKLYTYYPELKDVLFQKKVMWTDFGKRVQGWYEDGRNTIVITPYAENPLSTLLHEIQHWVQMYEGFAKGGNENMVWEGLGEKDRAAVVEDARAITADSLAVVENEIKAALEVWNSPIMRKYEEMNDHTVPLGTKMPELQDRLKFYDDEREARGKADAYLADIREKFFKKKRLEVPTWAESPFQAMTGLEKLMGPNSRLFDRRDALRDLMDEQDGKKIVEASGGLYELYRRVAGEVEARNVEIRNKMRYHFEIGVPVNELDPTTPKEDQLPNASPEATQDVLTERQFILNEAQVNTSRSWAKPKLAFASRVKNQADVDALTNLHGRWFAKIGGKVMGLLQFAEQFPGIQSLQRYVQAVKEWHRTKQRLLSVADGLYREMRKLKSLQKEALHTALFETTLQSERLGRQLTEGELLKIYDGARLELGIRDRAEMEVATQRLFEKIMGNGVDATVPKQGIFSTLLDEMEQGLKYNIIAEFLPQGNPALWQQGLALWDNMLADPQAWVNFTLNQPGLSGLNIEPRLKRVEKDTRALRKRNYFPLKRFGDHYIIIRAVKDGTNVSGKIYKAGQTVSFETYDNRAEAEKRFISGEIKALHTQGLDVRLGTMPSNFAAAIGQPRMVIDQVLSGLTGLTAQQKEELKAISISLSPGRAFLRHMLRRKLVKGFSMDAERSFGSYFLSASGYLARVKHHVELTEATRKLRDITRFQADPNNPAVMMDTSVLNEIQGYVDRHYTYIMNPESEWATLRSLGFIWYLGLNPASAYANLTQVPIITFADLGTKYNYADAAKAILAAGKNLSLEVIKGKKQDPEVARMEAELIARGILDESYATDIAATADAKHMLNKFDKVQQGYSMMLHAGAFMFAKVEKLNRVITARAAFSLARAQGGQIEDWIDSAHKAVEDSQFEYARWNRPEFMRGKKSVVFLFWNHTQNMLYMMYGGTRSKAHIARATHLWIVMMALAGLQGLPGAEHAFDLADALWQLWKKHFGDGTYSDLRKEVREVVGEISSPAMADGFMHGLSRYFGLGAGHLMVHDGVDLSGTISMGRLVPGMQEAMAEHKDPEAGFARTIASMAGPMGALGLNLYKMLESNDGNTLRAWEGVAPTFLRNYAQAVDMYVQGGIRQKGSEALVTEIDPGTWDGAMRIFMRSMGFQLTAVTRQREELAAQKQAYLYYNLRKKGLTNRLAVADSERDFEALQDVRADVMDFNINVPFPELRLNFAKALKARRVTRRKIEQGRSVAKSERGLMREYKEVYLGDANE